MTEVQYQLTAEDAIQHNAERPTPAATEGQAVPFIITETNDDGSVDGRAIIGTGDDPLVFHFERITKGPEIGQWSP